MRKKLLRTSLRTIKSKTQNTTASSHQAPWAQSGVEPCLQDLLNDPISDLLRARDGISISQICDVVRQARKRLQMNHGHPAQPCAACP